MCQRQQHKVLDVVRVDVDNGTKVLRARRALDPDEVACAVPGDLGLRHMRVRS